MVSKKQDDDSNRVPRHGTSLPEFKGRKHPGRQRRIPLDSLSDNDSLLRAITGSARDAILMMDPAGCISFWNPAAEHIFGYTRDEAMGRDLHEMLAPERYLEQYRAAFAPFAKTGQGETTGRTVELQARRKDGGEFSIELSLSSVRLENGRHVLGIVRDITEHNKTDERQRKREERLQRAERMEALGLLAGGIAHDLNNILGVLMGYSELLLFNVGEDSPARPHVTKILDAGEKAAAVIEDMLTLAGKGVQPRKILNLNTLIRNYLKTPDFARSLAFHPDIRIETALETELLNTKGSPIQLEKTITNLISNAVESMPKGGLLTIATRNQYMDRPTRGYDEIKEGDYAVFSVSDSGEGISPYDIKRIFEPFYTKKVMERSGTGLGLSVVWGTIRNHNGYLDVQSEEMRGSTFTLYFPATRKRLTEEPAAGPISEYLGHGETILVVDDVEEQCNLAAAMLHKLNYTVTAVSSGEEAVTYLREHTADLIVLDMIMDPGMDGLDTYRRILEIHPRQKAIIVSGFSETERVNAARKIGAGTYLSKPYIMEKLGRAVRKELEGIT